MNHRLRTSAVISMVILLQALPVYAQQRVYIWKEVDPGWKNRSIEHWAEVKGYGRKVPLMMADLIRESHSTADKSLELAIRNKLLDAGMPSEVILTDNPLEISPGNNDLFVDLQCRLLEVSDEYPNFRRKKLNIQPVIIYSLHIYDSKGELTEEKFLEDRINYRDIIRPTLRGLPEHRRDIEIVKQSFEESIKGGTVSELLGIIGETLNNNETSDIAADHDKFSEVIGLIFEVRKLKYPEDYPEINSLSRPEVTEPLKQKLITIPPGDNDPSVAQALTTLINESIYYALIISVNDYLDPAMNDLTEPGKDATKLYNTLVSGYSFSEENIIMLENPTRNEIVMNFDKLSHQVSSKDNLLIFYAGHGLWVNWFSNSDLRDYIGGIKARHTLLISDACFSGGIFKSREAFRGISQATLELYRLPSRKAMTSGAMTTVPDKSVFIEYLIKRLEENEEFFLSSEQLFASFKIAVINNSTTNQVPQFGEIRETGDEGGDFLFIRNR